MKLLFFSLIFLLFNYIYCENNILPSFIQSFQFKNNLNGDFGLMLLIKPEYGLMNKELSDNIPKYCCGNNTRYSNSLLIVNNEVTVSQWFKSTIQDEKCLNYQVLIPVDSKTNSNGTITMTIDNIKLIKTYNNKGFNNISEYKEYNQDPEKYLYCWSLNLNLIKKNESKEKSLYLSNFGEAWIYVDDVLKYDFGGIRDSNDNTTLELPDKDLNLKIFKCSRSNLIENSEVSFSITGFNTNCDLDPICGTCGETYCEAKQCNGDIIKSCEQKKKLCGTCISVPLSCDDNDPCTIDSCVNNTCFNKVIDQNCYCSKDNCISQDLCIQKQCINKHYCKSTPIICQGNSTCNEPKCLNGQCVCSYHQPITTTIGYSTSSPNILPSTSSICSISISTLIIITITLIISI